ncbi:hypothetical protein ON010_g3268 [Phytophthora cinnamomi]|nr:hypothetical protein ON010_g3268 [Phytophthora cinnamomi]
MPYQRFLPVGVSIFDAIFDIFSLKRMSSSAVIISTALLRPGPKSTAQASSASGDSSSKGKSNRKPEGRWVRSQPAVGPPARAILSGSGATSSSDSSPVVPSRKPCRVVEPADEDAGSSSTRSLPSEQVHVDSGASLEWFLDIG